MSMVTTVITLMIAVIIGAVVVLPIVRDIVTPWLNESNHSEGRTTAFTGTLQMIAAPIPVLLAVLIIAAIAAAMG
jgi:hypothetical protein